MEKTNVNRSGVRRSDVAARASAMPHHTKQGYCGYKINVLSILSDVSLLVPDGLFMAVAS